MKYLSINAKDLLSLLAVLVIFSSCEVEVPVACIKPEGAVVTETFTFDEFTSLTVAMDARVEVFEGEQEVTITAAQNVLDRIDKDSFSVGNQLNLEIDGCDRDIKPNDVAITVVMPSIERLAYLGDGSLETPDILTSTNIVNIISSGDGSVDVKLDSNNDAIDMVNSGDGSITISGEAEDVKTINSGDGFVDAEFLISDIIDITQSGDGETFFTAVEDVQILLSGDGEVTGFGTTENQDISVSGDGKVFNFELISQNTDVRVSGDGRAEIHVENDLIARISGDGNICFRGQPNIDVQISGDGALTDCN